MLVTTFFICAFFRHACSTTPKYTYRRPKKKEKCIQMNQSQ